MHHDFYLNIRSQHARSWKWTLCKLYGRFLWPFLYEIWKINRRIINTVKTNDKDVDPTVVVVATVEGREGTSILLQFQFF